MFKTHNLCIGLTTVHVDDDKRLLFEKVRKPYKSKCLLLDDERVSFIRSFHSSTLLSKRVLPQYRTLYIPPLFLLNPKGLNKGGPPSWCAERKVRVGAMRDENDLPLDV
jgi:hypothetical protein